MTALFADAFFFVALLNKSDLAHNRVVTYVRPRLSDPLLTTAWVLTEVADAMALPRNRTGFLERLELVRSHPAIEVIPPSPDLFDRGLDLYTRRLDKAWSLTYCISFVAMTEHGLIEALTGDHHFEQAGFQALLK